MPDRTGPGSVPGFPAWADFDAVVPPDLRYRAQRYAEQINALAPDVAALAFAAREVLGDIGDRLSALTDAAESRGRPLDADLDEDELWAAAQWIPLWDAMKGFAELLDPEVAVRRED